MSKISIERVASTRTSTSLFYWQLRCCLLQLELDPLAEMSNTGATLPWRFPSKTESSDGGFARLIAHVRRS